MSRSFLLPSLVVCAAGIVFPSLASAQVKVGVINLQRAVLETAEIKKASADMQAKYKPRQDALEKIQNDIGDLQNQIQTGQGKLSPAQTADLEAQGQRKQREATRIQEDLQADVERDRNEILQRAGQRMTEVVKKVAEDKGLDVVVDVTAAVFFKPALEVTDESIAAYDKAYPLK